ncbi:MAG: bifunctional methylenetetrahydrofolate dehydrogenase/methenyltetrahydrofolate cyclohydrolase FolD [Verrucomicrobia bacterium]|nr:bifunctional methylenetetrahydrofolate dehydrogenase/methenyltetrahydrofolate cyclohydrolase FolD [Verrucomicrobiota bacterium]MBT7066518.1 bifunctional methylenetetrahydrofolate dehydrogenase/methenyltetrahydrofolate cyclohydrolase FolD [Verrucomicrobiota bacterium]MBT7699145.1 bifunctional methylenetetrahydrofolate dehydrogenase/methenyltetrahydrofolate cyclohydrolase FolD [Verrucomicrobiota bacterium]
MTAQIIDGKQLAAEMRAEIKQEVEQLATQGVTPGLGVILIGDDPASRSYVTAKEKACAEAGIYSDDNRLAADATQEALMALIDRMNNDPKINGILLQLPLPKHMDENAALLAINPDKDVDGFHPVNVGKMLIGEECFLPCTPHGCVQMLARSGVETKGAHVVVVGRSNIVGKPVAAMLLQKKAHANATVTICHTGTKDIGYHTRQADIVIVAAGWPNTVTADMIKEGAVVIDVGVNRVEDASKKRGYRLVGDVDFDAIKEKASLITPVPGGVGPMTITMLLFNTVASARRTLPAT